MSLNVSLNIANTGLKTIEDAMAITSQNITNSQTPGYVSESASTNSIAVNGIGSGAVTGLTRLNVSQALQKSLYTQNASVAGLTTTKNSLSVISSVQGTTASSDGSTTIGTLTNNLQSVNTAFVSLTSTPNNSAAQESVISAAKTLTSNINTLSGVYQQQRQTAEDNVVSTVKSINSDLTNIGALSQQIMSAKANHQQTADLENQRYQTMNSLSSKVGVSFTEKPNGDMTVTTQDGTQLPTRPDQIGKSDDGFKAGDDSWPLKTTGGNISSSMYLSSDGTNKGGISGITIDNNKSDVTSHLTGGTLGANITLRDSTYPKMQAQLDSFSYTLINKFNNAGVPLFSNGSSKALSSDTTKTSPNGIVNLSSDLTVSQSYQDTPSLLTKNSDGSTGTDNISNVLNKAFSTDSASNSGSNAAPSSGLGPDGSQSIGYDSTQGLVGLATSLTTNQAGVISQASNDLTTATNIQTSISSKVANVSGVDVNSQLANVTTLQNSYAANAKVFSTVQTMFNALINAVQ